MFGKNMHLGCFKGLGIASVQALTCQFAGAIILSANCAIAQITSDGTLPNNSNVILEGNTRIISGGTQAGSNLFHSFAEFSVPTNSTARFNNAADIQNIITRVTGNSISNIDGLISANGTANLFLINPNGIIFGQSARLDIGGSFFATSADSIKFASGFEFSAKNPQPTPLLTINVPIGLQFGASPGSIKVQGDGQGIRDADYPIIDTQNALRVQPDQTLALVGGDLNLEGATLKTAGGRIELGSVGVHGLVSLIPTNKGFTLGYDGVQNFGNIQLSQQATADASGEGGGDIQLQGRRVRVTNGSVIDTNTLGAKQGGDLVVNATDRVEIIGRSGLFVQAYPGTIGSVGKLTINTRELLIRDGSQVGAGTFGAGNAGNLAVTADSVQLIGRSGNRSPSSSGLYAQASGGTGNAGDLRINTRELLIRDGARVSARTFSTGNGGNLDVTADSVQVIGRASDGTASLLVTQSLGTGNAGDLTINTRELLIRDGASVNAGTFAGKAKAGNIIVDANSIELNDAAEINANTTGVGGNIFLNSPLLLLRRGSSITTNALGDNFTGGNITIDAKNGFIIAVPSENSNISADSDKFRGGNVTINNTAGIFGIQPRNEPSPLTSDITVKGATADLSGTLQINNPDIDPNRGLVPLTIDVVDVASLVDDNICALTANSSFTYTGRGGLPPSPNNTLNSDAVWEDWRLSAVPTGRGEQGSRGVGETALRPGFQRPSGSQSPTAGNPPTLRERLRRTGLSHQILLSGNPDAVLAPRAGSANPEGVLGSRGEEITSVNLHNKGSNSLRPNQIVEAQGWIINKNGEVILTAIAPTATPHKVGSSSHGCQPSIAK